MARWLLAMLKTGGSLPLARNHRTATLVLPPHLATGPPRWPGWWMGTGR